MSRAGGLSELVHTASPVHAPGLGKPVTGDRGKHGPENDRILWLQVMRAILSSHSLSDEDMEAAQGVRSAISTRVPILPVHTVAHTTRWKESPTSVCL